MTENDRKLLIGLDENNPNTKAFVDAINARPIPAIEKPMGNRNNQVKTESVSSSTAKENTIVDLISEEGLRNIGNAINGRNPWEY